MPRRVLIVEDVPTDAESMRRAVERAYPGAELVIAATSEAAVEALEAAGVFDLALIDVVLRGSSGTGQDVARVARAEGCPAIIYVTGHPQLAPHGSWCVSKGDADALTGAVRVALGD